MRILTGNKIRSSLPFFSAKNFFLAKERTDDVSLFGEKFTICRPRMNYLDKLRLSG